MVTNLVCHTPSNPSRLNGQPVSNKQFLLCLTTGHRNSAHLGCYAVRDLIILLKLRHLN